MGTPYVVERFRRCLDLYLCPRVEKARLSVPPSAILPPLPNPKELRPFPTTELLRMIGHRDKVLCIAPDPTGHWLLSGSSDCTLRKSLLVAAPEFGISQKRSNLLHGVLDPVATLYLH